MTQPLYYKDLLSGQQPFSEKDLGRKGLSLAHLVAQHTPVPPFFIIQPDLYKALVADIFKDSSVTSLEEFRKHIQTMSLPADVLAQIEAEYGKLSGFGRAWVAARSSIVAPDHPAISFSGLLSSKLNIRGVSEIETAIKEIFLSLFTDRSYDYMKRNKISYGDIGTAIIIQKMVQAEVSGIMYTYDPITNNQDNVSIEAVFGLGDVLTDGNVNPDIYTVSKNNLEIIEKKIVPQEWMKVRRMGDTEELEHLQKITISQMWQYAQKLDDSLVRELAKLAETIEKALGEPQVIEWAMERGSLYVLQAKPIGQRTDSTVKKLQDSARKISSVKDIDTFSTMADNTSISFTHHIPAVEKEVALPPETLLFTGTPASAGISYGETLLISDAESLTFESLEALKSTITKRHIIVTNEFAAVLEPLFFLAGGVITNFGGANSDVGIVTREAHIPAIVGTRIATSYLQSGLLVKMDGASGAIYRVDFLPEELPEKASASVSLHRKKKKLKKKKPTVPPTTPPSEPTESKIELPVKKIVKKHDSPIKVFLKHSVASPNIVLSTEDNDFPDDAGSLLITVDQVTKPVITKIKKIKRTTNSDLFIALSDSPSLDALLDAKRSLAAQGIRRSKRVRFIVSLGSMYGILNSKSLVDLGIDGIVLDVATLSTVYRPGTKEIDAELWKLLSDTLEGLKKQKLNFIGVSLPKEFFTIPLRKELNPLLKKGVTAVVFTEELPHATETDVVSIEQGIMGIQLG